MAQQVKTPTSLSFIQRRLSAMYSDDGDSRDSGYSDTTTIGPATATTFDLYDELRDMDDVLLSDNSNDSTGLCHELPSTLRVDSSENINIEKSTVFMKIVKTSTQESSILHITRKRTIAQEETEVLDVKRVCKKRVLTSIDNETPPSRKFVKTTQSSTTKTIHFSSEVKVALDVKDQEEDHPIYEDSEALYHLPTIAGGDSTMAFRRIEAATLAQKLKELSQEEFQDKYILVDCRYPFEYKGGHILGAINLCEQNQCEEMFFDESFDKKRVPIFYCEYSQKRGPSMATILRSGDRCRNFSSYPNITFKELYLLDKGYKGFFEHVTKTGEQDLCAPYGYVQMDDNRHAGELKQFTLHRKYFRNQSCMVTSHQNRQSRRVEKTQARRLLFKKCKTTNDLPSPLPANKEAEEYPFTPDLAPKRLNFSMSSPDSSFT